MKSNVLLAREALVELVRYVFEHRNKCLEGITYGDLAKRIGRVNRTGQGHAHGMGQVLGAMGHLLQGLEGAWREPIPKIQSLVVLKSGPDRRLPDVGIREFWPDYPRLPRPAKANRMRVEHQKVQQFGSRWDVVLAELGLTPVAPRPQPGRGGSGGESEEHKRLKEYVRGHPDLVGASPASMASCEYALPSLDEIDVLFLSKDACVAVEVKSRVSDLSPTDYERGIYQVVKYRALLAAMAKDVRYGIPAQVRAVLLLEKQLPSEYARLADRLEIEVIERVSVVD